MTRSHQAASAQHLLIVEDEPNLAFGLTNYFETSGYRVEIAPDGGSALSKVEISRPNLVILDLMLPDMNGLEVLLRLRRSYPTLPIIILSARAGEPDRLAGLRRGADDYVTKPFSVAELEIRVQRHIQSRAATLAQAAEASAFGDIVVDHSARTLRRGGKELRLTGKEFDLLRILLLHAGKALTREYLLREVWNYPPTIETRTLDQHIARLRKKVEPEPHTPRYIVTVPRVGFIFVK